MESIILEFCINVQDVLLNFWLLPLISQKDVLLSLAPVTIDISHTVISFKQDFLLSHCLPIIMLLQLIMICGLDVVHYNMNHVIHI